MQVIKKPQIKRPVIKKPNAKKALIKVFTKYDIEILFLFCATLLFGLSAFLFGNKPMTIHGYMGLQLVVLIIGITYLWASSKFLEWTENMRSIKSIIFTLCLALLGLGIFYLSNTWNFLPKIPKIYYWSIITFFIPHIWSVAHNHITTIPEKIYQGWKYPYGKEVPVVEVINPIKIKFYIAKKKQDDSFSEFALNVPTNYKLGEFMHYFLHRYNYDKNPQEPIYISEDNTTNNLYDWVFRAKPGSNKDVEVFDPKLTFTELRLKEEDSIIVERYDAPLEIEHDLVINENETTNEQDI